ncbi:hypothetical protein ACIPVB_10915 [Microbacterium sp. NPDC090007]|uniref:hypothetical protein n=1 Tax=Microbacterium sp. NPDC090007 TaxID=3364204 RepID=UPI003805FAAC
MSALTVLARFASGVRVGGDRASLGLGVLDAGEGTAPATLLYGIDLRAHRRGRWLRRALRERVVLLREELADGPDYRRVVAFAVVSGPREAAYARAHLEAGADLLHQAVERHRGHTFCLAVVITHCPLSADLLRTSLCDEAITMPEGAGAVTWPEVERVGLRRALVDAHL